MQDNPITVIKETFMSAYVLSGCVDAGDSSVQTASLEHQCIGHLEPPSPAADLTTPNVKGKPAGEFNNTICYKKKQSFRYCVYIILAVVYQTCHRCLLAATYHTNCPASPSAQRLARC